MIESDTVSSGDRLSFTVFLAAALHAMLVFGVSFTLDSGDQVAPTLNVTLATHQSHSEPEKADFLAQFNQDASGTGQKVRELTTRQQAPFADTNSEEVAPLPQKKAAVAAEQDKRLLTAEAEASRRVVQSETENQDTQAEREGADQEIPLTNPKIASLQAKLDRIRQELANQPRVRRLTSVSTKASADAAYLNSWTQKIEQVGNSNFPQDALRQGIFGDLRMAVSLYPNGSVADIKILQSSGHRILDDAALQIVRLAAPFPPFPPEIRKEVDRLEIIRTWEFEIRGLSTSAARGV